MAPQDQEAIQQPKESVGTTNRPPAPEPAPAAFTCPVRMSPSEVISTELPLPFGAKALASTTPLFEQHYRQIHRLNSHHWRIDKTGL